MGAVKVTVPKSVDDITVENSKALDSAVCTLIQDEQWLGNPIRADSWMCSCPVA